MAKIIVVGLEDGPFGTEVLRTALDVASDAEDCEVHAIHVGIDDSYGADANARTPRELEHLRAVIASEIEGRKARVFVHTNVGDPARQIARLAEKLGADLVVVGTHVDSAIEQLLLGSVAGRVLRKAPCSVLVVRPPSTNALCRDCAAARASSSRLFCGRHHDDDQYVEIVA
ncbi:MAG: universal stress protein [Polyangiales bacterium]